jgi:hypothetical protein
VAQLGQQADRDAAGLELGTGGEVQHDTGEALAELLVADAAWTGCRVVQEDLGLRGAFEHEEMVETPMDDDWKGTGQNLAELETLTLGVEAIAARSAHDARSLAAVARHAAGDAQLLERHAPPEMGEDDGKRGGTALGELHLQDGRRADAVSPVEPEHAANPGDHPSRPSRCRIAGMTRVMGAWRSTMTSTATRVPRVTE